MCWPGSRKRDLPRLSYPMAPLKCWRGLSDIRASVIALDVVISVEEVGIFKPHPSVYDLATDRFGIRPDEISFQSSNAWDAAAAATFGMRVVWCNRYGQQFENLTAQPDVEVTSLADLPSVLGI